MTKKRVAHNKIAIAESVINQIIEDYKAGMSILQLCGKYNYREKPVTRILLDSGVHKIQPRQYHILEGKQKEIEDKYNAGSSMSDLAKEYCVTEMVIKHFFKKHKIISRPSGSFVLGNEKAITADYLSGMTMKAIAKKYSACPNRTKRAILKVATGDELTRIIKRSEETYRTYSCDESFLDVIDTEEKAYFLGYFYADGYNAQYKGHIMMELHEKDDYILERFRLMFLSEKPIVQEKPGYAKFIIYSRKLSDRLAELGCPQRKTFITKFPDWLNPVLMPHFIRGYNDGDGCISGKGKQAVVKLVGSDGFIRPLSQHIENICGVNTTVANVFNVLRQWAYETV